jgi:hypothetical protein
MVYVIQVCWQLASRVRMEQQWYMSYRFADSLRAESGWNSNGICQTGLLTACKQDQDGTAVPSWSCLQAVSKPVWHIPLLCVQWKTPDDGQRNCPKYVQFHSKNKFEKLVHLVGFIIRNRVLTLILLTRRIGWAPNNANKWQTRFNSAFKGLNTVRTKTAKGWRKTLSLQQTNWTYPRYAPQQRILHKVQQRKQ